MKLQHYLGGLEGLPAIEFEPRVFVQPWEQRIFGIHVAMMGLSSHLAGVGYDMAAVPSTFDDTWTWADLRTGAESMNPFAYFQYRYYEKWLGGISGFFVEQGYITEDELEARAAAYRAEPELPLPSGGDPAIDDQVMRYLSDGDSPMRGPAEPKFAVGDTVTVRNVPAGDHTRLPGFLRTRTGTVERVFEGNYAYFCSTGDEGLGPPMPVYAVRFDPRDLWGDKAEPGMVIYGELFEVYLEPAANPTKEEA